MQTSSSEVKDREILQRSPILPDSVLSESVLQIQSVGFSLEFIPPFKLDGVQSLVM